ncbi:MULTISPECIES: hypothetical protein [Lysobacter]|nr:MULTISPECIES: hypothetical protein [Lysobacter]UOF14871.1 hypothetical protein IEQ11_24700 [Lysobacter capsici]WND80580.1 hypothetical protein RJ610_25430 [Lysobacter capsici]WND85776.1 hypothetical protein RJ609_25450 [Lysobacter capsici]
MKMSKRYLSVAAFALLTAFSAAAVADQYHYQVIGEGYGHTRDQAYEAASYYASNRCYLNWGRSTQEQTILVEEFQPATGYWYVKLSEGCISED